MGCGIIEEWKEMRWEMLVLSGSTEKEANQLTEGNQKIYVQKQKQKQTLGTSERDSWKWKLERNYWLGLAGRLERNEKKKVMGN